MAMADKVDDVRCVPERVGEEGQMQQQQQVLEMDIVSEAAFSLPMALQLAWSAVLGCYTGSNSVRFDFVHVDSQASVGSVVNLDLERSDSAQVAMDKMSRLTRQAIGEPSDTLLAFLAVMTTDASTPTSHRHAYLKYHLTVECSKEDDDKRLALRATHRDSMWSSATVYFMLHQVRHAMHLMVQSLSVPVSALQSISIQGQKQLLDWDRALPREPRLETVWTAIEKRCREQPLKMAIESWDGHATYGELEQKVSAVAEKLWRLGLGLGPDKEFVGLLLDKSMTSTIILVGVIKAGCAFVLLDASQPVQRLKSMCETAAVTTAIASPRNMEAGSGLGVSFLRSANDFPTMMALGDDASHSHATRPGSALYAGFTSGSTGEPKGFVMQHVNFMSGLEEYCAAVDLRHDSRAFLFASYSFVVSITGQLAPLCHGACLCVPSQSQLENDVAGAIRHLRADWIAITPSAARILDPDEVPSLRTMVMVGEETSSSDSARWSHLNLYSLYGQSENSKGTMVARKKSATHTHGASAIGQPYYANAWIVDREDHNVLLPIGSEGELVIESPCLTRGYINDNTRLASAPFVTNPAWLLNYGGAGRQGNVQRLVFKTGDVARRNAADGSFQLVGRKGSRVKIRGQRVELGEIECQIRRLLPAARSVAVDIICPADDKTLQESEMLVAFILMHQGSACSDDDAPLLTRPTPTFQKQSSLVDAGLRDALPSFMVPGAYVELAMLPKTRTGKLHRQRLRAAAAALSRRALLEYSAPPTAYKEPRSEEEAMMQNLCRQILQLPRDQVGMDDTFIGLGGDSLTARQLVIGARSCGLSLTLQEILQPATLGQMASQSSSSRHRSNECEARRESGPNHDFATLREDFIRSLPESPFKNDIEDVFPTLDVQAAYASNRVVDCFPLHISGSVDVVRLHGACQALVARHAILRTVFHSFRRRLVQVVLRQLPTMPFVVQSCDGWNAALDWVEEHGSRELKKRYDVGKPIVGFALVTVPSEARHVLVMRLCHGQYDGLCLRPLVQDMWTAYRGVPLSIKTTDFKTHVQYCFRQRCSQAYELWRGILQGSQPSPRPLLRGGGGADDAAKLCLTTKQLPKIRPLAGATRASMIKTAWFEVVRHETKLDDVVFGQFIHVWSGHDAVIGPCMNVIPVRVGHSQTRTRRQILDGIQAQHAKTASADALSWNDIVANCTDWPADTEPASVVLHQNFDREIQVVSDGIVCTKQVPILSHWAVFPMLLVTHPRESTLDALLLMSSRHLGMRDPVRMLDGFARALELLQKCPDEMMESKDLKDEK